MRRLWNSIVFPFIIELNPKHIVEVGSQNGNNTMSMLKYCDENDAYLTCIDPFPLFDVDKLKKEYGDRFNMIEDLSLNVLSSIKDYDLILLDGDHNWYTIYNELKCVENTFNPDSFPVIIFHDVSWPYARRDLYYDPSNIPEEFRNEYDKKGLFPGESSLLDKGGLNAHLCNAIHENTPKNGVLTGIEDFLKETNLNLTFKIINAFHGLGIVYTANDETDEVIKDIILNSNITGIMEEYYLKQNIIASDEIAGLNDELFLKEQEISNLNDKLVIKKQKIDSLNDELSLKEKEISNLKNMNLKLAQKQNELLSSNSWRLTEPLRSLKNKISKK